MKRVEEKILIKNLAYARRIKSQVYNQEVYLTWLSSDKANYEQVEVARYKPNSNEFSSYQVTGSDLHNNYPDFIIAEGELNLIWFQQNPDKLFSTDKTVKNNPHNLYLQRFNLDLKPQDDRLLIDSTTISYKVSAELYYDGNRIHTIYNKYDMNNPKKNKGTHLYHASLDYNSPTDIYRHKLTGEYKGFPSLVVKDDIYYLSFIDINQKMSVKLVELGKFDGTITGKKLFSRQRTGNYLKLFKGPEDYLHLSWIQREGVEDNIYYANTKYPEKPDVLETLGVNFEPTPVQFLTTILYFFILPFWKLMSAFHVTAIIFLTVILLMLLNWLSVKFRFLGWLEKTNNAFVSLILILGGIMYIGLTQGFSFIFYPGLPPNAMLPFILIMATMASFIFIWRIDFNEDISLIFGGLMGYLWLYWVVQANLIFYAYQYFV